jgi:hypothetical protein
MSGMIELNKRLRKFFNKDLTDEMIWQEIIKDRSLNNIHQLRSLNAEAARALIENEKRMHSLTIGITEFSPEVAAELAQYKGERLYLNCVNTLSPESAKAIAQFKGIKLALNALRTISIRTLGRLSTFKGILHMDGIESIEISEEETRRAETVFGSLTFAKLSMSGIKNPSIPLLKALARFPGQLELNGIETLSEDDVEILVAHIGNVLILKGIKILTPVFNRLLARYKGFLYLSGAGELNECLLEIAAARPEEYTFFSAVVKKRIDCFKIEQAKKDLILREEKLKNEKEQRELDQEEKTLLKELEEFKFRVPEVIHVQEIENHEDPFLKEIDDTVLNDIELNLNYEISKKRNRVDSLFSRDYDNLSENEKKELQTLREEIEVLNDQIRKTLDILVERKELGAVIFDSTEDLAAYLRESGIIGSNDDTFANIDKPDLLDSSFVKEEAIVLEHIEGADFVFSEAPSV